MCDFFVNFVSSSSRGLVLLSYDGKPKCVPACLPAMPDELWGGGEYFRGEAEQDGSKVLVVGTDLPLLLPSNSKPCLAHCERRLPPAVYV